SFQRYLARRLFAVDAHLQIETSVANPETAHFAFAGISRGSKTVSVICAFDILTSAYGCCRFHLVTVEQSVEQSQDRTANYVVSFLKSEYADVAEWYTQRT